MASTDVTGTQHPLMMMLSQMDESDWADLFMVYMRLNDPECTNVWDWLDKQDGNCFTTVFVLMLVPDLVKEILANGRVRIGELTAVHGLPMHSNDPYRIWHGWVEAESSLGPIVLEWSNRKKWIILRDTYYEAGHIEQVWKFNREQYFKHALSNTNDSLGPFVPEELVPLGRLREDDMKGSTNE